MATIIDEKANGLTVNTTRVSPFADKPSCETLNSDAGIEKNLPRSSDVSTPTTVHANPFDTDIEAIMTHDTHHCRDGLPISTQTTRGGPECQVWPGAAHWRQKAKDAKINRRSCKMCGYLDRLSKRNRVIVKIIIGLLIVGIAVGVGLGVSKTLGYGVWKPHDS